MSSAKRRSTFFFLAGSASRQTPLSKAFRADCDRAVDVGLAAIGDMGEDLAVDRRDFGEGRAVGRRDIGAVDEGAAFDFERRGAGKPAFAGGRTIEHGFLAFFQISMEIARTIAFAWPDRNRIFRMAGCLTGMAPSLARSLHCALDRM